MTSSEPIDLSSSLGIETVQNRTTTNVISPRFPEEQFPNTTKFNMDKEKIFEKQGNRKPYYTKNSIKELAKPTERLQNKQKSYQILEAKSKSNEYCEELPIKPSLLHKSVDTIKENGINFHSVLKSRENIYNINEEESNNSLDSQDKALMAYGNPIEPRFQDLLLQIRQTYKTASDDELLKLLEHIVH